MKVLVTGGTGFIGSHTVVQLAAAGHQVVALDNLSNSKRSVLDRLEALTGAPVPFEHVDLCDLAETRRVFATHRPDAVVHFAALKAVGESVAKPLEYYDNNLSSTFSLLRAMRETPARTFVFSSSATVYGGDPVVPMTEDAPTSATNPYGWTKVMIEQVLRDLAAADNSWRIALLRYFNPVGAHHSGTIGEDPSGVPNNLMPFVAQVAVGIREELAVFGDDYDTVDGTGMRDFIHVVDLADGHVAALERIADVEGVSTWNLGTGTPTSVLQLVHAFERASGRTVPYRIEPRRAGDIAVSYADPARATSELGWAAERGVDQMCVDEWRWRSANPNGYPDN